jgi:hypothetical protein
MVDVKHERLTYFVMFGKRDAIKIGTTTHLRARLSQFRTCAPGAVQILALAWAQDVTEEEAHKRFAAYRITREWFRAVPAVLGFAASLRANMDAAILDVERASVAAHAVGRGRWVPVRKLAPGPSLADDNGRRIIAAALGRR